jgi:hypothetical protein
MWRGKKVRRRSNLLWQIDYSGGNRKEKEVIVFSKS